MDRPIIFATDPLTLVTVADMKTELGLRGDNDELDEKIAREIRSSVGFISEVTGRPFVDLWEEVV